MDDLFAMLAAVEPPQSQDDYFQRAHLAQLFREKVSRSQATGKDGTRVGVFEERLETEAALIEKRYSSNSYHFTTYKERLILRGASRAPRQISIPTVRDRLVLRALCQVLHNFAPETRGGSPHSMVKRVVEAIREGDQTSRVFVRIDVKDFFPSIAHRILNRELRSFGFTERVRGLCMSAIETPTGENDGASLRGVPQGLSVSGALAALYMLKFDQAQRSLGRLYFRYVDDILFICEEAEASLLLEQVSRKLKARGLLIHPKGVAGKTEISAVSNGIDFLGYSIGLNKVSVRQSSFKRMFRNILKVITDYKYRKDNNKIIFRLNIKITGCLVDSSRRGWMMFFSYTEDKSQLAFLDRFVRDQLKRVGFPEKRLNDIKRFVKSFHEIRYNLDKTNYIPNFDRFGIEEKKNLIVLMSRYSDVEVQTWSVESVDREFSRIISQEVRDLERDVGAIS